MSDRAFYSGDFLRRRYNGPMLNRAATQERLPCEIAGEALCCAETWQSGLLHRAYPSASATGVQPLQALRGFETHRLHQPKAGPEAVDAAAGPWIEATGLVPATLIVRRIIADLTVRLHRAEGQSPNMDWSHAALFEAGGCPHVIARSGHADDRAGSGNPLSQGTLARD